MKYSSLYPTCYQNFITCKQSCGNVPSTSGLYFENLTGINIKFAANIANSAYLSGIDMLNDKAIFAIKLLEQDLQAAMLRFGYYISEYQDIEEFCGFSSQTVTTDANKRGLQIARFSSITPNSEFYIENLYIKTVNAENITLSLYDGNNVLIESFTFATLADAVTVLTINKAYKNNTIRVVIDTPNVEVYLANCCFWGDTVNCCSDSFETCGCSSDSSGGIHYEIKGDCCARKTYSVNGWSINKKTASSYGVALRGGMRCALSAVMCSILPQVAMAVLYRAGVEVLNELIASDRLNFVTVYSADWAKEQIPIWTEKSNTLFNNTVDALLPNLMKSESYCIKCHERTRPKITSSV